MSRGSACVYVRERQRDKGSAKWKQEVSDSHVLELGMSAIGPRCQDIQMPTRPIVKPDNFGRQIGVTTIKLDASLTHTHMQTYTRIVAQHKSL